MLSGEKKVMIIYSFIYIQWLFEPRNFHLLKTLYLLLVRMKTYMFKTFSVHIIRNISSTECCHQIMNFKL